jgi:hypothetical protein
MARWSWTSNARAMRQRSPWLGTLAAHELAHDLAHAPGWRTCFWGHADNIVMPPSTALWLGAEAHHLRATAHVAMAFQPAVFSEVLRALDDDPASRRSRDAPDAGCTSAPPNAATADRPAASPTVE